MHRPLQLAIVLALAVLIIPLPVRGAGLSIVIRPNSVHALYETRLDTYVNMNGTGPFTPGNVTITLNATTSAEFAAFITALNGALKAQSAGAIVSNLFMRVNQNSPNQYTQNLTLTVIMDVSGIVTWQATNEIIDLSLRRITVSESLNVTIGSTTINENAVATVGNLTGALNRLSKLPSVNVTLNGHSSTISSAQATVATDHTFNFASLGVDLAQWYTVHATSSNTTYLTLDTGPILSLDARSNTTVNGHPYTAHVQVLQDPTGSVTAPGYATGNGDTVTVRPRQPAPALPDSIFFLLVILAIPLLVTRRAFAKKTYPASPIRL